jgi:hypothetical protein
MAGGAPGHGEAAPGDHLQTLYHLWLVGHQLDGGHAPWRDPYSFRPESKPTLNFAGWPFGVVFWPLDAAFGPVRGWNAFALLIYLAAGGLTCLWLRELGLPRGAALVGGLAFAIAPYRVAQSTGHLLGPISILLPLALYALERRWVVLAVAAVASIPLSGQVHLALGAVPFFCAYALVRRRDLRTWVAVEAAVAAAVAAGFLVKTTTIDRSHLASGRSLHAVSQYSAGFGDLVSRHKGHQPEQFVFLGWATPLLAAAGLVLLWRGRRGLAAVLGLGAVVPILLALGTNTPLYSGLWHALPPFRYPRVPERLMPIACLCLAALVAFAVARSRRAVLVPALAVALLLVDLHVHVYGASAAGEDDRAYAALRDAPPGRVLELPVFMPDLHYGSVYMYYDMQARRERPAGYSTVAPRAAYDLLRTLLALNCGRLDAEQLATLRRLGVRYVAVHRALYRHRRVEGQSCTQPPAQQLRSFPRLAHDSRITIYELRSRSASASAKPASSAPATCATSCASWTGWGCASYGRTSASTCAGSVAARPWR